MIAKRGSAAAKITDTVATPTPGRDMLPKAAPQSADDDDAVSAFSAARDAERTAPSSAASTKRISGRILPRVSLNDMTVWSSFLVSSPFLRSVFSSATHLAWSLLRSPYFVFLVACFASRDASAAV